MNLEYNHNSNLIEFINLCDDLSIFLDEDFVNFYIDEETIVNLDKKLLSDHPKSCPHLDNLMSLCDKIIISNIIDSHEIVNSIFEKTQLFNIVDYKDFLFDTYRYPTYNFIQLFGILIEIYQFNNSKELFFDALHQGIIGLLILHLNMQYRITRPRN